jgi:hypothetical protein
LAKNRGHEITQSLEGQSDDERMARVSGAIGSRYAPFETASVLAAFFQRFTQRFPRNQGQDWRMRKEEPDLMSGTSPNNAGVFIQKSLEGGGCDRWGRTPSGFPLSQSGEFSGQTSDNKSRNCLGLAQVICLPPSLETEDDRSRSPLRHGCFALVGKELLKCRSGNGVRRGARSLPLLKRAQLYWQAGMNECAHSLRLAESVGFPPSFQFCDNGMRRVAGHQAIYHGDSGPRWQLAVTAMFAMLGKIVSAIGYLPIAHERIAGEDGKGKRRREHV